MIIRRDILKQNNNKLGLSCIKITNIIFVMFAILAVILPFWSKHAIFNGGLGQKK